MEHEMYECNKAAGERAHMDKPSFKSFLHNELTADGELRRITICEKTGEAYREIKREKRMWMDFVLLAAAFAIGAVVYFNLLPLLVENPVIRSGDNFDLWWAYENATRNSISIIGVMTLAVGVMLGLRAKVLRYFFVRFERVDDAALIEEARRLRAQNGKRFKWMIVSEVFLSGIAVALLLWLALPLISADYAADARVMFICLVAVYALASLASISIIAAFWVGERRRQ